MRIKNEYFFIFVYNADILKRVKFELKAINFS